jgi:diacylglycerol kinase family enzyme
MRPLRPPHAVIPTPRRIVVVVNAGSGAGNDTALADRLGELFRGAGTTAEICLARGASGIAAAVDAAVAARPDIVVAGGGDGTVSTVAAALLGTGIALGVLPLGTLNHFAKDLGLPLDLEAAVAQIVTGDAHQVDVGEVNGRVFVNNSSLGLYPDIVRDRERQQKRLGRGKWPAMLWSVVSALRRYPFLDVRVVIDGRERHWRTPFVFIGNNEYRMEGFAIGERDGLCDGVLSLYVAQRPGRLRLLQLVFRALTGSLRQARDFGFTRAQEIAVDSRHRRLRVATDGEVTLMTPPLAYRVRRAALTVVHALPPAP